MACFLTSKRCRSDIQWRRLRVWDGGLKDVQHAVAHLVPGLQGEFLSIQVDDVLKTVGA